MTLVELIVGVTALAALLAGVLPAARSARNADLSAQCRHNLGRIQQAALIYAAADPGELIIPIGAGDAYSPAMYTSVYSYGGKSGWWTAKLIGQPADQSPLAGGALYRLGTNDRPLNRILFKTAFPPPPATSSRSGTSEDVSFDTRWDVSVYHCPGDAAFSGMHHLGWKQSHLSSYDAYGTSYAATVLLVTSAQAGMPLYSNSVYARPASGIPVPSETVAYLENAGRFAFLANNPALDQTGTCWPFSQGDIVAHGWHGVDFHFNVAFADGGAGWREIHGFGLDPAAGCFPGFESCDCVRIRGMGWRLDTIPAALAPTWKYLAQGGGSVPVNDGPESTWTIVQ